MEEKKPIFPHRHLEKTEAISFGDFCSIKFEPRPQIFTDFFKYMTGKDLQERPASPSIIRRDSLDAVENIEELEDDPDYGYFSELQQLSQQFLPECFKILNSKFDVLMCKHYKEIKAISLESLHENWHRIFGAKCRYLESNFYNILVAPDNSDITRTKFLKKVKGLLEANSQELAFRLYDKRNDGVIKADEVYEFVSELPESSPIFKECSR